MALLSYFNDKAGTTIQTLKLDQLQTETNPEVVKYRLPSDTKDIIGDFDGWSAPFVHIREVHKVAAPEPYEVIEPSLFISTLSVTGIRPRKLATSPLSKSKTVNRLIVVFHDWLSRYTEKIYVRLVEELRKQSLTTVIAVDWHRGAQAYHNVDIKTNLDQWYNQAVLNGIVVGRDVGHGLAMLSKMGTFEIHLIGVGLGAHVAYFAADWWYDLFGGNQILG